MACTNSPKIYKLVSQDERISLCTVFSWCHGGVGQNTARNKTRSISNCVNLHVAVWFVCAGLIKSMNRLLELPPDRDDGDVDCLSTCLIEFSLCCLFGVRSKSGVDVREYRKIGNKYARLTLLHDLQFLNTVKRLLRMNGVDALFKWRKFNLEMECIVMLTTLRVENGELSIRFCSIVKKPACSLFFLMTKMRARPIDTVCLLCNLFFCSHNDFID